LLVRQYEKVEVGQPLFHLDSPEWQKMQSDMVIALNAMSRSHAMLAVAQANENEMKKAVAFVEQRIAKLAEASIRQVVLEAELADERNTLPRLEAEVAAAKVEFDAAHAMYDVMLSTAASVSGIPRKDLDSATDQHSHLEGRQPRWRSITRLTIHAKAPGIVNRLPVTNNGWVETGGLVLDTADPTALRFHGDAMQSDINLFRNGQRARVVPPQGGSIDLQDTIDGTIELAFEAHPQQRTIPIYLIPKHLPNWAKSGVTAYLEVYANDDDSPALAIPETAVIRDGLEVVFFRRDPNDSNTLIRTPADLGDSDGRWVEVKSGVRIGDEIVLSGVYPLMLASSTSGERAEGGHFHADGTFHAGEDE
jgi:multidrug efflux pump subunit AcrA (membrane-fusion protein)